MISELYEDVGAYFAGRPLLSYLVADAISEAAQQPLNPYQVMDDTVKAVADVFEVDSDRVALFPNRAVYWDAILEMNSHIKRVYIPDSMLAEDYEPFIKRGYDAKRNTLAIVDTEQSGAITNANINHALEKVTEEDMIAWAYTSPITGSYLQASIKSCGVYAVDLSSYEDPEFDLVFTYSDIYLLANAKQLLGPDMVIGICPKGKSWHGHHHLFQAGPKSTMMSNRCLVQLGPHAWSPDPALLIGIQRGIEVSKYIGFIERPEINLFGIKIPGLTWTVESQGITPVTPRRTVWLARFDDADAWHLRNYLAKRNIHCDLALRFQGPWCERWLTNPGLRFTVHIHNTEEHVEQLMHALSDYGDEYGF